MRAGWSTALLGCGVVLGIVGLSAPSCNSLLGLDPVTLVDGGGGSGGGTNVGAGGGAVPGSGGGAATGGARAATGGAAPTATGGGGATPTGGGGATATGGGGAGGSATGGSGGRASGAGGSTTGAGGRGSGGAGGSATGGSGGRASGGAGGPSSGGAAGSATGGRGGSCGRSLLKNGNFDTGPQEWTEVPIGEQLIYRDGDAALGGDQMITSDSSPYVLRLGSTRGLHTNFVEQAIDIPTDALELTVQGRVQVRTTEMPRDVYDWADARIRPDFGPTFMFTADPPWTNLTEAAVWTAFTIKANVTALAGTNPVFELYSEMDDNNATYFYFDSLSLVVSACR